MNKDLGHFLGSNSKESACNAGDLGLILGQKDPLKEEMATYFSILGELHRQSRLVGYSPWGPRESDMIE